MLVLYSDVGERDAPTRIRVGSHLLVPPLLEPAGEAGVPFGEVVQALPALARLPVARATGQAGDIYLCHPFLVHAAGFPHRGSQPRFLQQPQVDPTKAFAASLGSARAGPVARAIQMGLEGA
jgi:hypothetical protein